MDYCMLRDSTGHSVLNFVAIEQELSERVESVRMRAPVRSSKEAYEIYTNSYLIVISNPFINKTYEYFCKCGHRYKDVIDTPLVVQGHIVKRVKAGVTLITYIEAFNAHHRTSVVSVGSVGADFVCDSELHSQNNRQTNIFDIHYFSNVHYTPGRIRAISLIIKSR
jgi:hypothetical protein